MTFNCMTSDARLWTSSIKNPESGELVEEGKFSIEKEHPTKGDFEGDFTGRRLKGKCLPDGMWFAVPADRPEFIYRGKYTESTDIISGKRTRLGAFAAAEQETAALPDEDWVATRPPTLLAGSSSEESYEEGAAASAEEASPDDAGTT